MTYQLVASETPTETAAPSRWQKPMSRKESGQYLREKFGIGSASLLAKLAMSGGGPPFRKFGKMRTFYDPRDVDAWARSVLGEPRVEGDKRAARASTDSTVGAGR
jgi:hypothetical protein